VCSVPMKGDGARVGVRRLGPSPLWEAGYHDGVGGSYLTPSYSGRDVALLCAVRLSDRRLLLGCSSHQDHGPGHGDGASLPYGVGWRHVEPGDQVLRPCLYYELRTERGENVKGAMEGVPLALGRRLGRAAGTLHQPGQRAMLVGYRRPAIRRFNIAVGLPTFGTPFEPFGFLTAPNAA